MLPLWVRWNSASQHLEPILLLQLVLGISIFLIPSNLFQVLSESNAYIHGIRIDYFLPKLSLFDIVSWSLIFSWLLWRITGISEWIRGHRNILMTVGGLATLAAIRQFFSPLPTASIYLLFQILEISAWGIAVKDVLTQSSAIQRQRIMDIAIGSAVLFQSLLGAFQFLTQSSLANFWLLGEPQLVQKITIASSTFLGETVILPYGTTPHPNILGGLLALGSLYFCWRWLGSSGRWRWIFAVLIVSAVTTLLLTQSLAAWLILCLGIGLGIWYRRRPPSLTILSMLIPILLILFPLTLEILYQTSVVSNNASIERRVQLNRIGIQLAALYPVTGTGLNTTPAVLEEVTRNEVSQRFLQPIHHTPLLILVETGLLGLLGIAIIGKIASKNYSKDWRQAVLYSGIILSSALALDHWLWTTEQGRAAAVLLLIMSYFAVAAPHSDANRVYDVAPKTGDNLAEDLRSS